MRAADKLKVTWSESKPNFPGHDKLHDYIRKAPIIKREFQMQHGNFEEGIKQAVRIIEGEYEFPTQSHAAPGPACGLADYATANARSTPGRRSRITPPRASPICWDCRAKKCGRSGCSAPAPTGATTRAMRRPTPPCCQSISASRCACSTCATKALPGTRRARPRSTAARSGSTPPARSSPTRTSARRSRARTSRRNEGRAADVLAGHLLGVDTQAGAGSRDSGCVLHVRPPAPRLGDRAAADGSRLADAHHASARSLRPAHPVRQRIVPGRGRGRHQHRSGRIPAALSHASARPRGGAHRCRALRLGQAAVATQRPEGCRRGGRPRHRLPAALHHLHRSRRRGARASQDRRHRADPLCLRARCRADRQSRHAAARDRPPAASTAPAARSSRS